MGDRVGAGDGEISDASKSLLCSENDVAGCRVLIDKQDGVGGDNCAEIEKESEDKGCCECKGEHFEGVFETSGRIQLGENVSGIICGRIEVLAVSKSVLNFNESLVEGASTRIFIHQRAVTSISAGPRRS